MAARNVQLPADVAHFLSPGATSAASAVLSTKYPSAVLIDTTDDVTPLDEAAVTVKLVIGVTFVEVPEMTPVVESSANPAGNGGETE
jgi:hypothetical protein